MIKALERETGLLDIFVISFAKDKFCRAVADLSLQTPSNRTIIRNCGSYVIQKENGSSRKLYVGKNIDPVKCFLHTLT